MTDPKTNPTAPSRTRRIAFTACAFALAVVALELILQAASLASPQIAAVLDRNAGLLLRDPQLIHRPNPAYPDHDAWGFRNDTVPERAFAVALGDSQTYGAMVPRNQAWPQQLADALGNPVYNMAFGGYGPGEASLLLDQALELKPDWILFGLYTGNDLFDAYELAYTTDSLTAYRATDPAVLNAIADANAQGPIEDGFNETHTTRATLKHWLAGNSKLYGLARAARNAIRGSAWQEIETDWPTLLAQKVAHPDWLYFDHAATSTVLTPEYRLLALDQSDPRIQEGQRITLDLLAKMAHRCEQANAQFAVVALPTKELVYQEAMQQANAETTEELERLWRDETAFWQKCKAACDKNGIPFIDTLAPLRESLALKEHPFRKDHDGHLTTQGNQIVSETIKKFVVPPSGGKAPTRKP